MKDHSSLHPWLHKPAHSGDFAPTDDKGGFWYYGPNYTADCIIFAESPGLHVALITRRDNGLLALPGGFIDHDETALDAALREANEEMGVTLDTVSAKKIYEGPVADHRATRRAWPHTTAYRFIIPKTILVSGDDADHADWYNYEHLTPNLLHGSHYQLVQLALSLSMRGNLNSM